MYALNEIPRPVTQDISRTGNTAYIIIVPGFSRDELAQQTCPHFETFVQKLAQSQDTHTKTYVFQHSIRAELFESWDQFAEAGTGFMEALNNLRDQGELVSLEDFILMNFADKSQVDADDLLLIGHGLGGFIIKKALVTAHHQLRHPKYIFETLAMLIMLGVPQLDSENKPDWIRLITACAPKLRKLPSKLLHEDSVLCLKAICDRFESFTIASPLVRVFGSLDSKPKVHLSLKKRSKRVQGCISAATAVVREYTTSDPERQIWDECGPHGTCALCEDSTYHQMLIAWTNEARQNFHLESNSDQKDTSQAPAEVIPQLIDSARTESTASPLQITDISEPLGLVSLSELTGGFSDAVNFPKDRTERLPDIEDTSEESTERSTSEALSGNSSASSDVEIEYLATRPDLDFAAPSLEKPSTSSSRAYKRPSLPFTYLPPPRDSSFFAHNDTLHVIEDHLINFVPTNTPQNQTMNNHSRVCILHGIAAVGKTSVALETAYRTLNQFNCVFWITADSEIRVSIEIHNIAVKLNILEGPGQHDYSKSLSMFLSWVEQSRTRSLIIYDNVESFPLLQSILPSTSNVSVIITTRDYTMSSLLTGPSSSAWLKVIEVRPFSLDEASSFLHRHAIKCFEADDPSACRNLASKLSGIPLVIRQTADLVTRRHLTFAEFLEMYEYEQNQKNAGLMWISEERSSKRESHHSSLTEIIEIRLRNLSAAANALLAVISFLHPEGIAESILTSPRRYLEVPLENFPSTVLGYTGARTELWNTAFCEILTEKRQISVHRLVQYQVRLHLSSYELNAGFRMASSLLLSQWPSTKKFRSGCLGNWPEFDHLQCHVTSLAKAYNELNAVVNSNPVNKIAAPDSFVRVLVYSAWFNWQRGSPNEGKPLFDLAHDILTESSIKSLELRRLKISVPQITFTFPGVEGLLGLVDHIEKINLENKNGNGEYETVSNMTRQGKTSLETPDPRVMEVHDSTERNNKRSAKDKKSSAVNSEDLEGDSLRRDHSLAQRGYIADDDSEEGPKLDLNQDTHADAYSTLEKGLSLIAQQKYFEAVGSLMVVKDLVSTFQGATNEKYKIYLSASTHIGIVYWLNGNTDLSLQTLLHALTIYQEMGRKGDQDSVLHGRILFALGNVHLRTGNSGQSLSKFSQALGIFESVGDEGSDWIAVTRLKLADLHIEERKHEQARILLEQCLNHFQSQSTLSAQAQTVRAIHRQALLYEAEGNKMMAKIFHAAARDGRAEHRRAKGVPDPEAGMPFEPKDLEADIEFWFR